MADETRRRTGSIRDRLPDIGKLHDALIGLDANVQLMLDLHRELRDTMQDTARLETQLESIKDGQDKLFHIVRDNNGRSVLSRLSSLELKYSDLEVWKTTQHTTASERRKQRWQLLITVVSGVMSILAAAVALWAKGGGGPTG